MTTHNERKQIERMKFINSPKTKREKTAYIRLMRGCMRTRMAVFFARLLALLILVLAIGCNNETNLNVRHEESHKCVCMCESKVSK